MIVDANAVSVHSLVCMTVISVLSGVVSMAMISMLVVAGV